jgi:hypothetical protein
VDRIEFDAGETGLRGVFKYYQEIALRVIQESPEGLSSKAPEYQVNDR